MKFTTSALFLATACSAQIAFVPSRPGNWIPGKPIFGVQYGSAGDTIHDRSLMNLSSDSIKVEALSMEIRSPGLEGEWNGTFKVIDAPMAVFDVQKSQYQRVRLSGLDTKTIAPQAKVRMGVSGLWDCSWPCTIDETVDPPDTLFKRNTANLVDTMDVRLGVYWRSQKTYRLDSAYLDCWIEFRSAARLGMAVQGREASPRRPPVGTAAGWQVGGGESWTLRSPAGSTVPLERRRRGEGWLLRPAHPFAGMGILSSPEGQSFRVVGVR